MIEASAVRKESLRWPLPALHTSMHLGVETETAAKVEAAEARLSGTGLETTGVDDTICCYASKVETWVTDCLTAADRAERGDHVGCIVGALSVPEYEAGLAAAGFVDVAITFTHADMTSDPSPNELHAEIQTRQMNAEVASRLQREFSGIFGIETIESVVAECRASSPMRGSKRPSRCSPSASLATGSAPPSWKEP